MLDTLLRQCLLLLQPVGFMWFALLLMAIVCWWKRRRVVATLATLLFLLITVVGSTDLPGWLLRRLESPWVGFRPADLPACDAIVVLGGGAEPSRYEARQLHLTKAGDRVLMGMELLRLGKAPVLLVGGGQADFGTEKIAEADIVRDWLQAWRPANGTEIISLGVSAHTRDESLLVARMVRERAWKRVALVTSANHMTRAVAVFREAGVPVIPAPCNFLTTLSTAPGRFRLSVPSWQGFEKTGIWMHETVGWMTYERRGWVR